MKIFISWCLRNSLVVIVVSVMALFAGALVAPFDWNFGIERDPVGVDAIPDIGENQQIVFTKWPGFSPRDIEDQVTYPLSSALLAMPGVKTIRASSMFGFSSIYVIFEEGIDFYWARSRILEKLNSLPPGTLPEGVRPSLGPDATALGQVFWYTLEGIDEQGSPTDGWDPQELRSIQDWTVRYALLGTQGIAEVASVGGYVKEYQVDVDPDAMRGYGVSLHHLMEAIQGSNQDVGARTMEVNRVEYIIRGVGLVKSVDEIENAVIKLTNGIPVLVKDVAHVSLGPAVRRGALNKQGQEAVGGVAVVRYGYNPREAIQNLKKKMAEIAPSLPKRTLEDGRTSQVTLVPFYDRTQLIEETLDTLNLAVFLEILVTIVVVLALLRHVMSSLIIASIVPLGVIGCFLMMKGFGVDANIVSLSGIAIAIGSMVQVGIFVCENILKKMGDDEEGRLDRIEAATVEMASPVLTALLTTVVSFLPVFTMEGAEGKLFKPLAFTKTFTIIAAAVIGFSLLPVLTHHLIKPAKRVSGWIRVVPWLLLAVATLFLSYEWRPLGWSSGSVHNISFVVGVIGSVLLILYVIQWLYPRILRWGLKFRKTAMVIPTAVLIMGGVVWSGMGKEFLPPLDEGSFLYMPVTMPHAAITESLDILASQNERFSKIPEVKGAVGKLGRVDSPLDPAPISMIETVVNYHPQIIQDSSGQPISFAWTSEESDLARSREGTPVLAPDGKPYRVAGRFLRDEEGALIADSNGVPFPLWRPPLDPELNPGREAWKGIRASGDIWDQLSESASQPGVTSAPMLQPIIARIVMLQSGMRAPMGIKVRGPTLESIESTALQLEELIKGVPEVKAETVNADRVVAKPYLEIRADRRALAQYGIKMTAIQQTIRSAIGGMAVTTTIEGRERYAVRIRYLRELRDQIEQIGSILVRSPLGAEVPLRELAEVEYVPGPQVIKSEDGFLVAYLTFDLKPGLAEVDVVHAVQAEIEKHRLSGHFNPDDGVSLVFAGNFENQMRAERKLMLVIPATLAIIFLILYLQFGSISTTFFVFTGVVVAWAGGFILLWLYGQPWFADVTILGHNMRELFHMHPINLSVAIWVGFLALFGIATDIGVIIASAVDDRVKRKRHSSVDDLREDVVLAATSRCRPAMMVAGTTLLTLLPVLTSSGRGADIMIPMAIPSFGGMVAALLSAFIVPILYCWMAERALKRKEEI